MKRLQCPYCKEAIHSETFREGEIFPCPNCEVSLRVESVHDLDVKASFVPDRFASGIFSRLSGDRPEIDLDSRQLTVFGRMLADSFRIAEWPTMTRDELDNLHRRTDELVARLPADEPLVDIIRFRQTLLDLYLAGLSEQDFVEGTDSGDFPSTVRSRLKK